MSIGIELISKERVRQIKEEGWNKEHDSEHDPGELCIAAACYAAHSAGIRIYAEYRENVKSIKFADPWPWDNKHDKRCHYGNIKDNPGNMLCDPKSLNNEERLDLLIKAGALIAAEIDKIKNEEK